MLQAGDELRQRLWDNTGRFRKQMQALGFNLAGAGHPIIPVMIEDAPLAQRFAQRIGQLAHRREVGEVVRDLQEGFEYVILPTIRQGIVQWSDTLSSADWAETSGTRLVVSGVAPLSEATDRSVEYANLLGYNYLSSEWYEKSYKIFNKDYKISKQKKAEKEGVIKRFKKLFD